MKEDVNRNLKLLGIGGMKLDLGIDKIKLMGYNRTINSKGYPLMLTQTQQNILEKLQNDTEARIVGDVLLSYYLETKDKIFGYTKRVSSIMPHDFEAIKPSLTQISEDVWTI